MGVTRLCETCKRRRPLREFDLAVIHLVPTCRLCYRARMTASSVSRREQLDVLEQHRRSLIADLVKVDSEIAQLRSMSSTAVPPQVSESTAVVVVDTAYDFGD